MDFQGALQPSRLPPTRHLTPVPVGQSARSAAPANAPVGQAAEGGQSARSAAPANEAAAIWSALLDGKARVVEERRMADLWQCVVERAAGVALDPLERLVIQQIVLGVSYKCIAYELGASSSTLHDRLTVALRRLGLNTRIAAVRIGAALTADDAGRPRALVFPGEAGQPAQRAATANLTGDRRLAVVAMRPEPSRIALLSPCERQIVFLALDGLSNAAIASRRQTSTRTIANQLASVYQRVGVSGRLELARHLFEPAR